MSRPINFIQYRLAHVPHRRERWLAPTVGRINVLHNRRLSFDEHFVDDESGQTKRTYYKVVEPKAYLGKFCAHLNGMINQNRKTGRPAIFLSFHCTKEITDLPEKRSATTLLSVSEEQ